MKLLRKSVPRHISKTNFIPFSNPKPRHITHLPNNSSSSSKQANPTFNSTFHDQIQPQFIQIRSFSDARSNPSSQNNVHSNTHLCNSSYQPKPIFRTTFVDPFFLRFAQIRPFSSHPFPKTSTDCTASEPTPSPSLNKVPVVSTVSSPIDAGSSIRIPISLWPGMYHSPVANALWEARSCILETSGDVPIAASSQNELVTKTPSQSRTSVLYKFSSDYILREQYRNPWNEIRTGKVLEDLDALAGTISYKHCCNEDSTTRPLLLVTASVDKIVFKKPIRVDTDLTIAGAVTWVGRSSMEIQLEVAQSAQDTSDSQDSIALVANFTFVARDSKTGKSAPINRISPESDQEKLLWEEAEERNKMRKIKRGQQKRDIEKEEVDRLQALLAEGRIFCDMPALADRDSILISDTCLGNSLICQPQQRNTHGRIFGGFLMRKAAELAFATAYAFAGAAPRFKEVDRVDFLKPVDVGDFLRLKSCILYTQLHNPAEPLINIEVKAHVTQPELRSSEVSNTFYFTLSVRPEAMRDGLKIKNVVPATEEEARRVLERMDAETS